MKRTGNVCYWEVKKKLRFRHLKTAEASADSEPEKGRPTDRIPDLHSFLPDAFSIQGYKLCTKTCWEKGRRGRQAGASSSLGSRLWSLWLGMLFVAARLLKQRSLVSKGHSGGRGRNIQFEPVQNPKRMTIAQVMQKLAGNVAEKEARKRILNSDTEEEKDKVESGISSGRNQNIGKKAREP